MVQREDGAESSNHRCRAPWLCGLSVGVRFKKKGRQRAEPIGKILAGKARAALWTTGTETLKTCWTPGKGPTHQLLILKKIKHFYCLVLWFWVVLGFLVFLKQGCISGKLKS